MKYIIAMLLTINVAYAMDDFDFSKHDLYMVTEKEEVAISNVLKNMLRDPDSLQLRGTGFAALRKGSSVTACREFGAKNAYGGYGDPSLALVFLYQDTGEIKVTIGKVVPETDIASVEANTSAKFCLQIFRAYKLKSVP